MDRLKYGTHVLADQYPSLAAEIHSLESQPQLPASGLLTRNRLFRSVLSIATIAEGAKRRGIVHGSSGTNAAIMNSAMNLPNRGKDHPRSRTSSS